MTFWSKTALLVSSRMVFALAGCAPAAEVAPAAPSAPPALIAPVASAKAETPPDHADEYAAALEEAFASYEAEVQRAAALTFHSQAEVEVVRVSLRETRFDLALSQSLRKRDLSVDGLAELALSHPDFFHTEQRRHWGRLARTRATVENLRVAEQLAMADTGR